MTVGWWWLELTFAVCAVDVDEDGLVVAAPALLKTWNGQPWGKLVAHYKNRGLFVRAIYNRLL